MAGNGLALDSRPSLKIFLGPLIIGFAPILVKWASAPAWVSGFYRVLFGALVLSAIGAISRRFLDKTPPQAFSTSGRKGYCVLAGVLFAMDLYFWHKSIEHIGAGLATLLANTQVFFLMAYHHISVREKPALAPSLALTVALVGVCLCCGLGSSLFSGDTFSSSLAISETAISETAFSETAISDTGILYGLLTAACYAGFILSFNKANRSHDGFVTENLERISWTATITFMVFGLLLSYTEAHHLAGTAASFESFVYDAPKGIELLIQSLALGASTGDTLAGTVGSVDQLAGVLKTLTALLLLGGVVHAGGWRLIGKGFNRVSPAMGGLVLLAQPVFALILGVVLLDEGLTFSQQLGTFLTLGGIYIAYAYSGRPRETEGDEVIEPSLPEASRSEDAGQLLGEGPGVVIPLEKNEVFQEIGIGESEIFTASELEPRFVAVESSNPESTVMGSALRSSEIPTRRP